MRVKEKGFGQAASRSNQLAATELTRPVFTVGHSTRALDEFIELLKAHGVQHLVDVRTIPRSRRNPQFNSDALAASLKSGAIDYTHCPGLGGLRHTHADSPNTGWRNASFRGYADYMQTPQFAAALQELIKCANGPQVAIMCAEAVPWRCHRSLVADALLVRGIPVEHIMSRTSRHPHKLTPFAKVQGLRITYPAEVQLYLGTGQVRKRAGLKSTSDRVNATVRTGHRDIKPAKPSLRRAVK